MSKTYRHTPTGDRRAKRAVTARQTRKAARRAQQAQA